MNEKRPKRNDGRKEMPYERHLKSSSSGGSSSGGGSSNIHREINTKRVQITNSTDPIRLSTGRNLNPNNQLFHLCIHNLWQHHYITHTQAQHTTKNNICLSVSSVGNWAINLHASFLPEVEENHYHGRFY